VNTYGRPHTTRIPKDFDRFAAENKATGLSILSVWMNRVTSETKPFRSRPTPFEWFSLLLLRNRTQRCARTVPKQLARPTRRRRRSTWCCVRYNRHAPSIANDFLWPADGGRYAYRYFYNRSTALHFDVLSTIQSSFIIQLPARVICITHKSEGSDIRLRNKFNYVTWVDMT